MRGLSDTVLVALVGLNASTNGGTLRIDNFELDASVSAVPLVPSLVLLSSGVAQCCVFAANKCRLSVARD